MKFNNFNVPSVILFCIQTKSWKFESTPNNGDKTYDAVYWQTYVAMLLFNFDKVYISNVY